LNYLQYFGRTCPSSSLSDGRYFKLAASPRSKYLYIIFVLRVWLRVYISCVCVCTVDPRLLYNDVEWNRLYHIILYAVCTHLETIVEQLILIFKKIIGLFPIVKRCCTKPSIIPVFSMVSIHICTWVDNDNEWSMVCDIYARYL